MGSDRSFAGAIRAHALLQPSAHALLAPHREPCTYARLHEHIDRLSECIGRELSAQNRIIAVALPNGPDLFSALVAAMSAGTCAPVAASVPGEEMDAFLGDIRPALVITDADGLRRHREFFERHGVAVACVSGERGEAGVFAVDVLPASVPCGGPGLACDADVVLLVRTSGTTTAPRVVPHTMPRLMHSAEAVVAAVGLTPSDRCLNARPLHHLHALMHVIGASIVAGASVVCPPEPGAAALVEGFRTYDPTWYSASPPVHRDLLAIVRAAPERVRPRLRFARSSSAALDPDVAAGLEAALGMPILQGYGMSEAPVIALNPMPPGVRKHASVGRPIGCEVRIEDEAGRARGPNLIGEVVIRGTNVAPAYALGDRRIADASGWFHTGDSGMLDDDGYLFLTGRLNELINVGGEKVAPANVERALRSHVAVAEAVVFALPHPTLGEHVGATVVAQAGFAVEPEQIIAHATALLPRHSVPNVVHVASAIARDANGKVRRRELAVAFAAARDAARQSPGRSRPNDDSLRHALARIWEEVLERPQVELDENFFAAGGDSLRAVRVMAKIETALGVALPADMMLRAPTIDGLARAVLAQTRDEQRSRLIALRPHGSRPPLIYFDGDINGGGLYARFLLDALDPDQPIYVLRPYGVFGDPVPPTVEIMAEADAALIARAIPSRTYRLAGYCNGGVVAFEVARRLEGSGLRVDVLALIGSSAPNAGLDALRSLVAIPARFLSPARGVELYRTARRAANTIRSTPVPGALRYVTRASVARMRRRDVAREPVPADRSTPEFRVYEDRLTRYFPRRYARTVDVIWADDDTPRIPNDASMGWRHVARVRRASIGGDHTTMLTDHVGALGAALRAVFDVADGTVRAGEPAT